MANLCLRACSAIFAYETPRVVLFKSYKIGVLYRFIQLLIIIYVIGYAIIYHKGYQSSDTALSSVTTKMKGIAFTNPDESVQGVLPPAWRDRIWDVADYVVPPQENNALFVMTNAIVTPNQTQGLCGESPLLPGSLCNMSTPNACHKGTILNNGNGVETGLCVSFNSTVNTCQVKSWCPVEYDKLRTNEPLLVGVENFTLLLKNFIEFPQYNVKRRNLVDSINNESYLRKCRFDSKTDPLCPIFEIGNIVEMTGENMTDLFLLGGVIGIEIEWDCNLDFSEHSCLPSYSFRRLDDAKVKIAPGWSFRYSNVYYVDGKIHRDLFKAYGILFSISVNGKAGKFNFVPLMLNVASGLALLSLSPIICDLVLLYVLPSRKYYSEKKYIKVLDEDINQTAEGGDNIGFVTQD